VDVTKDMEDDSNRSPLSRSKFSRNETTRDERIYALGMDNNIWDEALTPFNEENKKSYLEILEDLNSGKINFVWEVWAMRNKCPKDYTPSQCDATILAYIDRNYTGVDRDKLKDLYTSYFKYEDEIRKFQLSHEMDFVEKYELIREKRRSLLGDEKSKLIFGMEEAQVDFIEGSHNFIKSTKNMKPDERVKKYEELRKKTYGSYYENMMKREDRFDHYTTEIQLRESEMEGLSPEEKEAKLAQLEVKYFGKEKAELIAKARQEEKAEQSKFSLIQKEEEELLKKYPNLSEKEREKKIQEIRVNILGKEDAEMYTRRIKFEEETKNLNY
jgi:hypothetical protein